MSPVYIPQDLFQSGGTVDIDVTDGIYRIECALTLDGDEEYIFLFPCAVLDIDWEEILSGGGFPTDGENTWNVCRSFIESGYDVIKFLQEFYDKSMLYDVIKADNDRLEVIFDQTTVEKGKMNSGGDVRYDGIFKNAVAIYYDEVSESIHISAEIP